jgi:hypothetical protein
MSTTPPPRRTFRSRVGAVTRSSVALPGFPNAAPLPRDYVPTQWHHPKIKREGSTTSLVQDDTTPPPPTQLTTDAIAESPAREAAVLAVETAPQGPSPPAGGVIIAEPESEPPAVVNPPPAEEAVLSLMPLVEPARTQGAVLSLMPLVEPARTQGVPLPDSTPAPITTSMLSPVIAAAPALTMSTTSPPKKTFRSRVGTVMRRSSTSWTMPGLPNSTPPSDDAISYSGPPSPPRGHEGFTTSLKQLDTTPPTQLTPDTIPDSPAHESVALAVEKVPQGPSPLAGVIIAEPESAPAVVNPPLAEEAVLSPMPLVEPAAMPPPTREPARTHGVPPPDSTPAPITTSMLSPVIAAAPAPTMSTTTPPKKTFRSRVGTVMRRSSTSWTMPWLPNSTLPSDDAISYSEPHSPHREHEDFTTSLQQLDTTLPTQSTPDTSPESPAHESVALAVEKVPQGPSPLAGGVIIAEPESVPPAVVNPPLAEEAVLSPMPLVQPARTQGVPPPDPTPAPVTMSTLSPVIAAAPAPAKARMPTPPVLAVASTQTPAALPPTGATTSQLTESQLALTIDATQDVSLISEAGGYGLNDLLNKYIKGDAGAVVSVVLPPLLANIDIFAKFAGKFTEVMAPLLDHHT